MNGLDLSQIKQYIVRPALAMLPVRWASEAAVNLVTGTGLVESGYVYVQQLNDGPAASLWQMEEATHNDCWNNFLNYQPELKTALLKLLLPGMTPWGQMQGNMYYAAAMCRVKYIRSPLSLPSASDALGMAEYHKNVYNSAFGAADSVVNMPLFATAIAA